MKSRVLAFALSVAALTMPTQSDAAVLFTSREGWSIDGDAANAKEQEAVTLMQKQSSRRRRMNSARLSGHTGPWSRNIRFRPSRAKLSARWVPFSNQPGEYDEAYNAYAAYLTKYPKGDDFESVVESMFKIAKLYLEGEKKKILGFKIASSMQRAQEMFEGIVKRAPYSRFAALAQFNSGQALEKQGNYDRAIAAYTNVVAKYPTDAIAGRCAVPNRVRANEAVA
jgi:tetratricopeptide (TPR) repeat protein